MQSKENCVCAATSSRVGSFFISLALFLLAADDGKSEAESESFLKTHTQGLIDADDVLLRSF